MKKIAILLVSAALLGCNKNTNQETKNTKVLWAETVQSNVSLVRDSLWDEADWNAINKYDKEKIFSSITQAVLSGKLKAYFDYPSSELTIKEFNNILVQWDSTNQMEDPKNPGTMITAPMKMELTSDDIVQLRFNEKIELDTISYTLNKKVSFITFLTYKTANTGEILGLKYLFDVKLNDLPNNQQEKKL